SNQLLVVTGDSGPVEESGAVATLGLDYEKLGFQTGQMAIKVLTEGADPATMAVEAQTEFNLIVNKSGAEALGVELPQAVLDKAETVIE
ncbi:MAG: sugar ABC transporter substrate-binding protein, partial [Microbacteriaceae bacterium]|nr:sugar ABC transporter substrate-binding protein [Microbacteriaceae bacterium]